MCVIRPGPRVVERLICDRNDCRSTVRVPRIGIRIIAGFVQVAVFGIAEDIEQRLTRVVIEEIDACMESLTRGDMEDAHVHAQNIYNSYLDQHEKLYMLHTHRDIVLVGSDMVLLITDIEMQNQPKALQSAKLLAFRTQQVRTEMSVALENIF